MNDDALHPDLELASAYLDGDVSADERARVEGDSELLALSERLADARRELADVPAPPAGAREAALAAALAEFDLLAAGTDDLAATADDTRTARRADATEGATVLSFFRRRGNMVLAAAAAALLVGVVGVTLRGTSSDDSSSTPADAAEETAEKMYSAGDTEAPAEMAAEDAPMSTISGIAGPASAWRQVDDTDGLLALAEEFTSFGDVVSEETMAPTAGTDDGAVAGGADPSGDRAAFPCPLGDGQEVLAEILWIDTHAWAVLDTASGAVSAVGDDCAVLAVATP